MIRVKIFRSVINYSNPMKRTLLLLLLTLGLISSVYAQTAEDKATVIRLILEHPSLKELGNGEDGSSHKRYILQHPVRFDEAVMAAIAPSFIQFAEDESTISEAASIFRFRSMGISSAVASGVLNLLVIPGPNGLPENYMIHYEVHKRIGGWEIARITVERL